MIINIPLQINEEEMSNILKKDYEAKVIDEIVKYITTAIEQRGNRYNGYRTRFDDGMMSIIYEQVDKFLEEHRDDIIKMTADILADKLRRTKRVKDAVDGVLNGDEIH